MPPLETIYLIHHSHTDIGFTYDQPILWEMERRFIDEALDVCEQYADDTGDHAFRWTVETVAPFLYWLKHSSDKQIERFIRLEKAKRIEIAALYANMTPLVDSAEWIELMQPIHDLRRTYGFSIQSAMNCDVNGHNWTLPDMLLDAGISGFSMAINEHSGGAPINRPNVFQWQAPSGRTLNTLNGWHYMMGNWFKVGEDLQHWETVSLPFIQQRLQAVNWSLPMVMLQLNNPYGDNSGVFRQLPDFIRTWNAKGLLPRIKLATLNEWWSAVAPYRDQWETVRGDWTDFWNYGCGSSARETTINRASRSRLLNADALLSTVNVLPKNPAQETRLAYVPQARKDAWHALAMYDEHTWGDELAVHEATNEESVSEWSHKGGQAYIARSLSLMMQRDGLAELAQHIPAQTGDALVVYNPLPWARHMNSMVSGMTGNETLRGQRDDAASARQYQDHLDFAAKWWVQNVEVPAYGYAVVRRDQLRREESTTLLDTEVIENDYHRLRFDKARGGLKSWYDKRLKRELIDRESPFSFGNVVYERPAKPTAGNPRRTFYKSFGFDVERQAWVGEWAAERWSARSLKSHYVRQLPGGWQVTQTVIVPELASAVTLRVYLPEDATWVEFDAEWSMGLNVMPEATYVAMPFALAQPQARFDVGGVAVEVEHDQIQNTCKDYFTVQNWVDLSGAEWGITIACPDNPMVQLGDFTYGLDLRRRTIDKGMFLGWVTNNYWETNFRGHQPGKVSARYIVQPHEGTFNEQDAHHFGLEQSMPMIAHSRYETPRTDADLPRSSSLLNLPPAPILTLHILADEAGGVLIRLLNASDSLQQAVIGSALLKIVDAKVCDLFGQPTGSLIINNSAVSVDIEARRVCVVRLGVQ